MGASFSTGGERVALLSGARAPLVSTFPSAPLSALAAPAPAPGGEGAPAPPAPPLLSIPRVQLLHALEYRQHRFRHCRSLPLSLLSYAAFIATLLLHAKVSIAYDLQSAAASAFVNGSGFSTLGASAQGWYAWAADGFLPLLLPEEGSGGAAWALRPLNGYAVVVGGARVAQARSVAVACTEDAGLRALYATPCYPSMQLSSAPFGGAPANASAAPAFAAGPGRGAEGEARIPYAFELILDAQNTSLAAGRAAVAGLRDGGWLDAATRSVTATAVLFNGQIATWATVRCTMDVLRGGRLSYSSKVDVFPADPYGSPPNTLAEASDGSGGSDGTDAPGGLLVFLDLVVLVYFLYLARGTAFRVWLVFTGNGREGGGAGGSGKPAGADKAHHHAHAHHHHHQRHHLYLPQQPPSAPARPRSCVSRLPAACGYWLVLDYVSLCTLLAMGVTWLVFVRGAAALRGEFSGVAAPSAGVFASAAFAGTAARAMECQEAWDNFKVAATLALICLSLRLFKYFKFQPRLAVMTDSLSMACSDAAHFAFLFAVMLVCYGTWGSFMFGHASMDWSNTGMSLMAVFRYMMYDYNLDTMSSSFPVMANVFYITMMLLLTNMVLWMFLAIVLESYTEVRARSHGAPSLLEDAASAWVSLPRAAALLHGASCGRFGEPSAGLGDVIDALNGRLGDAEEVTAPALAAGVPHLPRAVAEELILDALAWSAGAEGGEGRRKGRLPWVPAAAEPGGGARSYSENRLAAVQRAGSFTEEGAGGGAGGAGAGGSSSGSGSSGGGGRGGADVRARAAALGALLERARSGGGGDGGGESGESLEALIGAAARFIAAAELAKRGEGGK